MAIVGGVEPYVSPEVIEKAMRAILADPEISVKIADEANVYASGGRIAPNLKLYRKL